MKTLSIFTPCYNEEGNIEELYLRVRAAMASLDGYRYEHVFIDNASCDNTLSILKAIARRDRNVKIIANARNFGPVRSSMHGIQQASGDAVIAMAADLQDPPELIVDMVHEWERGTPIVIGVKSVSDEHGLMFWLRTRYYRMINRLSGVETYEHFTGFGLYDRKVMDLVHRFNDQYFRGVIADIGLPHVEIVFNQPKRKRGVSKIRFYNLYEIGMQGITSLSKVPLQLVTFSGFASAFLSVLVSLGYFIYKLIYWNRFSTGIAPLVIGVFFFMSLQMIFIGVVGEYIGAIHTIVQNRPLVVEQERVNFEYGPGEPLADSSPSAQIPMGRG
jgi:glycosyltransferase involved in cell wall biosynthesis